MKPNTPEWYAARKGGIGASDAPIIMGVSPWKSIHALYKEKKTPYVEGTETSNFAMNHGKATEPEAMALFVKKTGFTVSYDTDDMMKWNQRRLFDGKPWQFATYDVLIAFDPELRGPTFCELKCPLSPKTHIMAREGVIPEQYYVQIQQQIDVDPVQPEYAWYASYYQNDIIFMPIFKDEEMIEKIAENGLKFMEMLKNNTPPERKKSTKKSSPIVD